MRMEVNHGFRFKGIARCLCLHGGIPSDQVFDWKSVRMKLHNRKAKEYEYDS